MEMLGNYCSGWVEIGVIRLGDKNNFCSSKYSACCLILVCAGKKEIISMAVIWDRRP